MKLSSIGQLKYLSGVTTLEFDQDKCCGCGICAIVCPHRVFQSKEEGVKINNRDRCMECGACAQNCPTQALTVRAGVGCAYAIIMGAIKGTEPTCDCSSDSNNSCC